MTKKVYRVRNWKDYNRSLVSRGSLTFWFSPDLLKNWENTSATGLRGRSNFYANEVITTALTLRQLFRLTLRQTQGLMESLIKIMDVELRIPNYTTLSRRAGSLNVNIKINNKIEPRHILVDSTGIQVIGEGEWKRLKHGSTRYQVWKKLHIAMDSKDQTILSALMTDSIKQDGNYLGKLLNSIKDPILSVKGDGAYDKKPCYRVLYNKDIKAIIPPQHNAIVQRNKIKKDPALFVRDNLIERLGRGNDRMEKLKLWKQESNYHQRSLIETMMSRMKSIFGDEMRSRKPANQHTDLMIRCYAMNKINTLGLSKSILIA